MLLEHFIIESTPWRNFILINYFDVRDPVFGINADSYLFRINPFLSIITFIFDDWINFRIHKIFPRNELNVNCCIIFMGKGSINKLKVTRLHDDKCSTINFWVFYAIAIDWIFIIFFEWVLVKFNDVLPLLFYGN